MGNLITGAPGPEDVPRVRFKTRGSSLGLAPAGTAGLVRRVEQGLPFKAFELFSSRTGLAAARLASVLGIPERTLARRKTAGRLAPDESERLLRVSLIFEKAVELFEGRPSLAVEWLARPKRALDGKSPLEYARTELGARDVENLIGRLEHGVFS